METRALETVSRALAQTGLQRDRGRDRAVALAGIPLPSLCPSSPLSYDFAPAAALPVSGADLDTCYFLYAGKA